MLSYWRELTVNAAAAASPLTNVFPNKITGNFLLMKDFSYGSEKCGEQQKHKRVPGTKQLYHESWEWCGTMQRAQQENSAFVHYKESARLKKKKMWWKNKKFCVLQKSKKKIFFFFIQVIASAFGLSQWKRWDILCFWIFSQMSSSNYWFLSIKTTK